MEVKIPRLSGMFVRECTIKKCGSRSCRAGKLFFAEGLTVGTLIHSRIQLMGANHDFVQRAIVFTLTMVGTLLDGTLDALVCIAIHHISSFLLVHS